MNLERDDFREICIHTHTHTRIYITSSQLAVAGSCISGHLKFARACELTFGEILHTNSCMYILPAANWPLLAVVYLAISGSRGRVTAVALGACLVISVGLAVVRSVTVGLSSVRMWWTLVVYALNELVPSTLMVMPVYWFQVCSVLQCVAVCCSVLQRGTWSCLPTGFRSLYTYTCPKCVSYRCIVYTKYVP